MTLESAGRAAADKIGIDWHTVPHDGRFHDVPASGKDTRNTSGRIRVYADEEGGQVWNWTTGESLYFWVKGEVELDPAAREARRFFGGLALPQEMADAVRLDSQLIDYCRREKTDQVPTRKIQQYGPCGLRTKVAIEAAVKELEGLDRVRLVEGNKRRTILVNPKTITGEL